MKNPFPQKPLDEAKCRIYWWTASPCMVTAGKDQFCRGYMCSDKNRYA